MSLSRSFVHPNPTTFDFPRRQYFSLPYGLISYITDDPCSANGYEKLQKCCKYFFAKSKIVVVNVEVSPKDGYFIYFTLAERFKIYMKKFKLWLNESIFISDIALTRFINSIYRCNLKNLWIYNQNLTYAELKFLLNGGKITWLRLSYVNIRDKNRALISFVKILGMVPNIKDFNYFSEDEIFTSATIENMNSLAFKSKLYKFSLSIYNVSADFDITLLCKFIKKYAESFSEKNQIFQFWLRMNNAKIYRSTLQASVDQMLEEWQSKDGNRPNIKIC